MISICMIVKNEEAVLARALNSVKDIADEIIIVDTGSSDYTKKIAKIFRAKIYDFLWVHDFSDARNFALSKCTMPWILIIDADETISKSDCEKIKEIVEKNDPEFVAHSLVQRNYANKQISYKWNENDDKYEESKGYKGWHYRRIIRLFRNNKKIRFIYPIHETVRPSAEKAGKVSHLNIPIHHFCYESQEKQEYYLKLLKKKIEQHPNEYSYAELGMHLLGMGNKKEALGHLEQAVRINKNFKPIFDFASKN